MEIGYIRKRLVCIQWKEDIKFGSYVRKWHTQLIIFWLNSNNLSTFWLQVCRISRYMYNILFDCLMINHNFVIKKKKRMEERLSVRAFIIRIENWKQDLKTLMAIIWAFSSVYTEIHFLCNLLFKLNLKLNIHLIRILQCFKCKL